ncbi:MAG: hypothetical protein ABFS14_01135 [Gemmatimonadota bacterium]
MNAQRRSFLVPAAMAAAVAAPLACRDAPGGFVPTEASGPESVIDRVTFNQGDDRFPSWSADGESLLYSAEGFGDLPQTEGLLLSIPTVSGPSEVLFPVVQTVTGPERRFFAPAASPTDDRVAYVHVIRILPGTLCGNVPVDESVFEDGGSEPNITRCSPNVTLDPLPRLDQIAVRVRRPGTSGIVESDPTLAIDLPGRVQDESRMQFGIRGFFIVDLHPFHRLFNDEGTIPGRPSWSPTGDQLVLSDGLNLLLWRPGENTADTIPGTADGISPSWSPDGAWIAFSQLERGPESFTTCQHFTLQDGLEVLNCVEDRTDWPILRRRLVIVRPDGSEPTDLTEGEEPAWDPTGRVLYFRRGDRLWRYDRDSASEEPVLGTVGGRDPAVSPDGQWLAFSRPDSNDEHDIWIAELP